MATPNYFVSGSIARDDTATWQDREDGSQPLAVTLTREDDGATDAHYPVTLTVDLDLTDDAHVIVRNNGAEVNGDVAGVLRTLRNILEADHTYTGAVEALAVIRAELEAQR